jgi:hypothetical protein
MQIRELARRLDPMKRVNLVIATLMTSVMVMTVPFLTRDGVGAESSQLRSYPPGTQQIAQDDSNDNGQQADQPSDDTSDNNDNSGNSDQMNAQQGDDNGGDSSQMNSAPDADNSDSSGQMNSDSGDSQSNQGSSDSQ